jgi:hypothetical protein
MRGLKLSPEQQYEICMIIGQWYLDWKKRDIKANFGYAKEELKTMICEGMQATEFSKRDKVSLVGRDEPLKNIQCTTCKKREIQVITSEVV